MFTETRCDLRLLMIQELHAHIDCGQFFSDWMRRHGLELLTLPSVVDFGDILAISSTLKITLPAVLLLDLVLASLPSCTDAQTVIHLPPSIRSRERIFSALGPREKHYLHAICNRCQASQEGHLSLEVV